jgi:hypothetical protein
VGWFAPDIEMKRKPELCKGQTFRCVSGLGGLTHFAQGTFIGHNKIKMEKGRGA